MQSLRKCTAVNISRLLQTINSVRCLSGKQIVIEPLEERELVRVKGEEAVSFLQGLITNDMGHFAEREAFSAMYTLFLNKAGRVMYDSIIYRTPKPDTYLIECDKSVSIELHRQLRLYRVRRHIEIDSMKNDLRLWVLFNPDGGQQDAASWDKINRVQSEGISIVADPRLHDLGARVLTKTNTTLTDLTQLFTKSNDIEIVASSEICNYRRHRYNLGVGEGALDLPPGKSFPLEANCDYLHGVSFHKGCYLGQELTARVHHTGVVRKRLMPLQLTAPVTSEENVIKSETGVTLGTLRGVESDKALALIRVENALKAKRLLIDGHDCTVTKPQWWPTELSSREALP